MTHTRRLLAWPFIVAAAAVVLLAAVGVVVVVHAQDGPIPGGVYAGTLVDSDGPCSQGALTLGDEFEMGLNSPGTAIRLLTLHDLDYVRDSHGRTRETVHQRVEFAIAFDGSFDVPGVASVHIDGRFQGETVSGSFRVVADTGVVECDGTFSGQAVGLPVPLEALIDLRSDGCGGGSVSVTVSGDGSSLIAAAVTDLTADGQLVSGSATFDEGTVPVAENRSVDVYFPGGEPGQEIALNGTLIAVLSGVVTVSPSTCGPMAFRFFKLGEPHLDFGLDSSAAAELPDTGGGAAPDRGRIGLLATALAATGVATFVLALALRRRRGV